MGSDRREGSSFLLTERPKELANILRLGFNYHGIARGKEAADNGRVFCDLITSARKLEPMVIYAGDSTLYSKQRLDSVIATTIRHPQSLITKVSAGETACWQLTASLSALPTLSECDG